MKNTVLLLSSVLFYSTSLVSYAKNDSASQLNLAHCSTISSSDARLACFDNLYIDSAKQPVVTVTAVVPSTMDNKSVEQKQIDNFAKEDLKKTKTEQGPDSIFATISKIKQLLRGQWVIDLENGQKWQQTNTIRIKLKVGDKIRLEKAALGAIYLYKEGSHRSIKVKRLK